MKVGYTCVGMWAAAALVAAAGTAAAGQAAPAHGRRAAAPPAASAGRGKLATPSALNEKAPETFKARFDTSKGVFVVDVHREWAPLGADRFYNLVKNGFYDDVRFFRVLEGFMAQFGMNGVPAIQRVWGSANFKDDPVTQSNKRGYITFAKSGAPNSRSTQVFINFVDNTNLDSQGFAPFGQIVEGMDVVDKLYTGYGRQNVPDQGRITNEGNAYLNKDYPMLDFVKKATIQP
jgi:peptidyl-prolyl cis-trans isomerase A (cyclophilin A)